MNEQDEREVARGFIEAMDWEGGLSSYLDYGVAIDMVPRSLTLEFLRLNDAHATLCDLGQRFLTELFELAEVDDDDTSDAE